MTDSKRAPSESEENVHRHATPVDDSPGAASEPDTTALPESTLHQRTIAPDYIVPAFDAESPTTSADPAEVDALVEKSTRAASDDLFTDAYASWNYPEPWFELWCSAAAKCSGWVAWNGREFEVIADTYASGVAQVRGYLDVAEVTPVAPPLPPEPAAGSVVRAHGRLWHSKADFWHTSLGDVPKKWADLAAAPDLSPVVPVDDVCDWLDSRLVPEAVAFRAEFGGWDQ